MYDVIRGSMEVVTPNSPPRGYATGYRHLHLNTIIFSWLHLRRTMITKQKVYELFYCTGESQINNN